jgi:hypothetical protein
LIRHAIVFFQEMEIIMTLDSTFRTRQKSRHNWNPAVLSVLAVAATLTGCAYDPCYVGTVCSDPPRYAPATVAIPVAPAPSAVVAPIAPTPSLEGAVEVPAKFVAVGYGNQGGYTPYSLGQQKLMAMRAAQIDAYRNLAEQVHGFRVWGNTAVSAFMTQNDSVRTYVDSFIRGARVVNMTSIGDGNFEVTVELTPPPDFAACVRRMPQCTSRSALNTAPRAMARPVVAPSVIYTSP